MSERYDLQRFVTAQDLAGFDRICAELRAGEKRTHWMWFVFPQIAGLGSSARAIKYALGSLDEAKAYLAHPVLGPRLVECTRHVNAVEGKSVDRIFGHPDELKFHSSMTLFARSDPAREEFRTALQKYFAGAEDSETIIRI